MHVSDDHTRLTFNDIGGLIEALSDETLKELAEGPIECDPPEYTEPCRLCRVLDRLAPEDFDKKAMSEEQNAAVLIVAWHDYLRTEPPFSTLVMDDDVRGTVRELSGALAYARCFCIYTGAQLELCKRAQLARV